MHTKAHINSTYNCMCTSRIHALAITYIYVHTRLYQEKPNKSRLFGQGYSVSVLFFVVWAVLCDEENQQTNKKKITKQNNTLYTRVTYSCSIV